MKRKWRKEHEIGTRGSHGPGKHQKTGQLHSPRAVRQDLATGFWLLRLMGAVPSLHGWHVGKRRRKGQGLYADAQTPQAKLALLRQGLPSRYWKSIGVNNHVKLARKSAPRSANRLARAISNTSGKLVDAHHRGVDHLHRGIMCGGQCVHDACPDSCPPPTNEPIVAGRTRAIDVRKIAPRRTRPQYPEDAIENTPIIHTRHAARLVRQHHSNGAPFVVGKLISHDCGRSQLEARSISCIIHFVRLWGSNGHARTPLFLRLLTLAV